MSTTIDTKVVEMKFDNKQFEAATKQTLATLENLNKGLKLEGAAKGLHDLGSAAKNFSLSHISNTVDAINDRFRAMSVIALTALSNITNQAIYAGQNLIKSLTIAPINDGLKEYELNLNSIQTILANTGLEGQKGLNKVTSALDELNEYADQTIYNFAEMAKNIGTFTAAGVKLDVATAAIKGISNLAAVSGSNAEAASRAMYQLSQALAAGKITLMDWNSVVQAGMGGKVFKDAIMETARVHGVAIDQMIKDEGSFNLTLQKGWFTSEILTETLSKFTGDLTDKQLKSMGYSQQQIKEILKLGKVAKDAATKVKTMSQLIETLQSVVGSGWAKTWQLIFGDFEEARTLWTGVNDVLGGFIQQSADARNKVLGDWKELNGRTVLIDAIGNAFKAVMAILAPIKDAFREIFPATTGQQLYNLTYILRDLTRGLIIGGETAQNLKRTFAGVFAILGIGWDIIKEVAKTLFSLFGTVGEGSASFLEITARIGDFLVNLRKAMQESGILAKIFGTIGAVLEKPLQLIKLIGDAIGDFFDRLEGYETPKGLEKLGDKLEPLSGVTGFIAKGWEKVLDVLGRVFKFLTDVFFNVLDFFANIGTYIQTGFEGIKLEHIIGAGATTLIGGLLAGVLKLFTGGGAFGIIGQIKETIDSVTGAFNSMQNTLRAATLLQIALALGVLTLSVMELSRIDSEGLTRALTAMTVMFAQLGGALFLFEKHLKFDDIGKMYAIVGVMAALGIAIRLLTSAVKDLADLSWEQLATGLLGVTVLLVVLIGTVEKMPDDKKLFATAISLNVLALAIKLLVSSVKDLAELDWEDLSKGLIGVGALLGGLFLFTKFMAADKGGIAQGAGLLILAAGIKVLASAVLDLAGLTWEQLGTAMTGLASGLILIGAAVKLFPPDSIVAAIGILGLAGAIAIIADSLKEMGAMSWETIGKGLAAMAGALLIIGLAVSLIPPTAPLAAAGVLILALALGKIGDAFIKLGDMEWEAIGKATVALTAALGVITGALLLLPAGLAGAAALLVVVAALAVLVPIMQAFGAMSWEEIGKGMAVLSGFFLVLGLAGVALTAVVPTLLGLGAAIMLLGAGLLFAGVGIAAFSVGLKTLSLLGADGAATMKMFILELIGLIPLVMVEIANGIIAFAGVITNAAPAVAEAITVFLLAMLQAIDTVSPQIIDVLLRLLTLLLKELETAVPKMVRSGYKILIGILEGIRDNIQKVVTTALEVIAKFIDGIAKGLPTIITSGVNLIISFIKGLTKAIDEKSVEMGEAGGDLAVAIINGMIKGLGAGVNKITKKAKEVAKAALDAAKDILGINSPSKAFKEEVGEESGAGIEVGLNNSIPGVEKSAKKVGLAALESMRDTISNLSSLAVDDMDLTPVITPVLDLSNVKKNASAIDGLFSNTPLTVKSSYSGALAADNGFQDNQDDRDDSDGGSGNGTTVNFTQNNYSPKALPEVDIYRKTNSGLSKVLEEVTP